MQMAKTITGILSVVFGSFHCDQLTKKYTNYWNHRQNWVGSKPRILK